MAHALHSYYCNIYCVFVCVSRETTALSHHPLHQSFKSFEAWCELCYLVSTYELPVLASIYAVIFVRYVSPNPILTFEQVYRLNERCVRTIQTIVVNTHGNLTR
jgi:hypothetical protein